MTVEQNVAPAVSWGRRLWQLTTRLADRVPGPLSLIADLAGAASLVIWAFALFNGPAPQIVTASFVCLVAAGAVVAAFYLQHLLDEEKLKVLQEKSASTRPHQLARAQPELAEVSKSLSRAIELMATDDRADEVRVTGKEAMEHLAAAFSTITGASCRATVKQTSWPNDSGRMTVQDLFRSHPAGDRPRDHVDWLHENTHFEELLANGWADWLTGNLKEEYARGYRNSHITNEDLRNDRLPYRSVLVVRISAPGGGASVGLQGFLCIDSLATGTFRREFDVSTAEMFAHELYSILTWFRQRAAQAREEGVEDRDHD